MKIKGLVSQIPFQKSHLAVVIFIYDPEQKWFENIHLNEEFTPRLFQLTAVIRLK